MSTLSTEVEMAWMFRPKFSDDGQSYVLERWQLVPKKSIKTIGKITFEELQKMYWRGADNA